jgi:LysR family transcriptional regulator for metE and metH
MNLNLDVRDLQMVAAIAAAGSVTRAAEELHLTQSALSHRLRAMEDRLGTALFLRLGKRMVPTAAGDRVLATALRVLEDLRASEEDVRRLRAHPAGLLRVCAQCNTGYHWLPPLADVYRRRYPDVELSLAVDCTHRPLEALLEGKLDLALLTQAVRHDHVQLRPLFEDEYAAVVAPDHPFAKRAFVRPQDFAAERLMLYSTSPDDSFTIQRILRPAGVVPRRISFVMLTEAILEMVKARLGISVMQTWAIEPAVRAGDVRAIPITAAGIRRQWHAATLKAAGRVAYVDAFIDLLASQAMPARRKPLPIRRRSG